MFVKTLGGGLHYAYCAAIFQSKWITFVIIPTTNGWRRVYDLVGGVKSLALSKG